MLGSTRGPEDEALVAELQRYAAGRGVASSLGFFVNRPFSELQMWMSKASVGVHRYCPIHQSPLSTQHSTFNTQHSTLTLYPCATLKHCGICHQHVE